MRMIVLAAAFSALTAGPVLAQGATSAAGEVKAQSAAPGTGQRPIDNGPNTPEANSAYRGGGVVLQGAPGAPAPQPQATPPGKAPRNLLPQ